MKYFKNTIIRAYAGLRVKQLLLLCLITMLFIVSRCGLIIEACYTGFKGICGVCGHMQIEMFIRVLNHIILL